MFFLTCQANSKILRRKDLGLMALSFPDHLMVRADHRPIFHRTTQRDQTGFDSRISRFILADEKSPYAPKMLGPRLPRWRLVEIDFDFGPNLSGKVLQSLD